MLRRGRPRAPRGERPSERKGKGSNRRYIQQTQSDGRGSAARGTGTAGVCSGRLSSKAHSPAGVGFSWQFVRNFRRFFTTRCGKSSNRVFEQYSLSASAEGATWHLTLRPEKAETRDCKPCSSLLFERCRMLAVRIFLPGRARVLAPLVNY